MGHWVGRGLLMVAVIAAAARGYGRWGATSGFVGGRAPRRSGLLCRGAVSSAGTLSAQELLRQDAAANDAILAFFAADAGFARLADRQQELVTRRDKEDAAQLLRGTQLAVDKGLLPEKLQLEPVRRIQVARDHLGLDATCQEIIDTLGDSPKKGCIMTLQGLSGTGKGTTVARLSEMLPNAHTWSNGNLFRSLALLAGTYAEQKGVALKDALRPEVLAELVPMLQFDDFGNGFDVRIQGLGLSYMVSDVQLTVLKQVKNIPTVAAATQGEVINFVQDAVERMSGTGANVILEGREQTLNYIRTPHRFELVLENPRLVGERQAALRIGAAARERLERGRGDGEVAAVLREVLGELLTA